MTQQQKKVIRKYKNHCENMTRIFNEDFNRWFDLQLKGSCKNVCKQWGLL